MTNCYKPLQQAWQRRGRNWFSQLLGLNRGTPASTRVAESLDYEPWQTKLYFSRLSGHQPERRRIYGYTGHTLGKFSVTLFTGVITGLLAVALAAATEHLLDFRNGLVESVLNTNAHNKLWIGYGHQLGFSVVCVFLAAVLVQYWAPTAAGAGVSLVMAYLNGNDIPELLQLRTLVVKAAGSVLGSASGLTVGLEGPMVHLGANVASVITSLLYTVWVKVCPYIGCTCSGFMCCLGGPRPGKGRKSRQHQSLSSDDVDVGAASAGQQAHTVCDGLVSNTDMREFVSAGAAAGIAAAFGAPIGGVLFSMEEACSYWSRKVAWRCFVCAAVSTFTIAQLHPRWQSGMLSFARNAKSITNQEWLFQLPLIIIVSGAAGLLGAVFNLLRRWLWSVRASRSRHFLRILEALAAVATIVTAMFFLSYRFGTCLPVPEEGDYGMKFMCPDAHFNDLATLYFSSPADTIIKVFSLASDDQSSEHQCVKLGSCYFTISSLAILSATYVVMMALSSSLAVPGGMFMPSIMVGASFGAMYGMTLLKYAPPTWKLYPGLYAIVSATAVLGGVFRSSISLVVIVVEGTRGINFLFGIIIAVVVSNWIAHLVHHDGVYESELERDGSVFYLRTEPPHALRHKSAACIMAHPVIGFNEIEAISRVVHVLQSTPHNGFPVFGSDSDILQRQDPEVTAGGRLEGLILRSQLMVLLQSGLQCDEHGTYVGIESCSDEIIEQLEEKMKEQVCKRRSRMALSVGAHDAIDLERYLRMTSADLEKGVSRVNLEATCAGSTVPWPAGGGYLDLRPFMNQAPLTVRSEVSAVRVHQVFVSLVLRHLCVVDHHNRVVGIITRKDLDRAAGRGWWRKNRIAPEPPQDEPGLAEGWRRDPPRPTQECSSSRLSSWVSWPLINTSRGGSPKRSPPGGSMKLPRLLSPHLLWQRWTSLGEAALDDPTLDNLTHTTNGSHTTLTTPLLKTSDDDASGEVAEISGTPPANEAHVSSRTVPHNGNGAAYDGPMTNGNGVVANGSGVPIVVPQISSNMAESAEALWGAVDAWSDEEREPRNLQ